MNALQRRGSANAYLRCLAGYSTGLCLASIVGSRFTDVYGNWTAAGTSEALRLAAFSLGPAVLLVAVADLPRPAALGVHLLITGGIVAMWWFFASSDSSTSARAFAYGWVIGIPVALAVVSTKRVNRPREGSRQ